MKKVSADTISDLTLKATFNSRAKALPTPSAEDLIQEMRAVHTKRLENLSKIIEQEKKNQTTPPRYPSAFEISYRKTIKQQKNFEKLISDIPKGFKLVPVLYSKINKQKNKNIYQEFSNNVRPEFFKFLSEKYPQELKALGLSEHAIERMKKGQEPKDISGHGYGLNIDHIVERSGGGHISLEKEFDPLMPEGSKKTYRVNHFNNLILIPEKIHDLKNEINNLQRAADTPLGESKWVLMLVPEEIPGYSGFIARPQDVDHPIYKERQDQKTIERLITKTSDLAEQVRTYLYVLKNSATAAKAIAYAKRKSAEEHKPITSIIYLESKSNKLDESQKLSHIFQEAVSNNNIEKELLQNFTKPTLKDMAYQLKNSFQKAQKSGKSSTAYKTFTKFYKSEEIAKTRKLVRATPLEEASFLESIFHQIELDIKKKRQKKKKKKPNHRKK